MKPWTESSLIPAPAEATPLELFKWNTKDIDVLRITAKGKKKMMTMNTTMIGQDLRPDDWSRKETTDSEQWLKHIPDILQTGKASHFDWNHRSLVIANIVS